MTARGRRRTVKVRSAIGSPAARPDNVIGYFPVLRAETKAMTTKVIASVKIAMVRFELVCTFRSESIECFIEILLCCLEIVFSYNVRVKNGSDVVAS